MELGTKLFLTAKYGFDYDRSVFVNLLAFDRVTEVIRINGQLEGYIVDEEKGDYIENNSEMDYLFEDLYEAFDDRRIEEFTRWKLEEYELYGILQHYKEPECKLGKQLKEELINSY